MGFTRVAGSDWLCPQSLLFTGSIADNVRWGDTQAEMDAVLQATMQAQIHASVEDFPNGYDTKVGQKGVNLSGAKTEVIYS